MSFASKLFKNSKNITLEKIAAAPGAVTSPGSWDQWEEGSPHNRGSLPIDYTLQGFLLIPIQIEIPIVLARTHRNRIEKLGYFRSTPVVQFRDDDLVETYNSIYRITETLSEKEEE